MASITVTPANARVGVPLSITGEGFTPSAEVVVDFPSEGITSEIIADGGGFFGTDDVADHATAVLTATGNPIATETVVIGAVTYTFRTSVGATANEILIGANAAATLLNLKGAINLSGPVGAYGTATVIHPTVTAAALTATTLALFAKTGGTAGNALASTETSTGLSFGGATFAGGSAASGVSALSFIPGKPATLEIKASDGTNTATASVRVFT